jgi:hypothetical protein
MSDFGLWSKVFLDYVGLQKALRAVIRMRVTQVWDWQTRNPLGLPVVLDGLSRDAPQSKQVYVETTLPPAAQNLPAAKGFQSMP